ncbi:hypothetical protein Tco_0642311 [Tanacetum coccineum]
MTMGQSYPHILLVCQSVQGHLNPSFQLANNLICAGARVTLATTVSGFHKLKSLPSIHGLSLASFTDGHDENSNAIWNPGMLTISNALDPSPLLLLLKPCLKVVDVRLAFLETDIRWTVFVLTTRVFFEALYSDMINAQDIEQMIPPTPPRDTEPPVGSPISLSSSSLVGSSSLIRSTTPPPDYPFNESIFRMSFF